LDGEADSYWVSTEVYGLPSHSIFNVGNYREAYDRCLGVDTQRHSTRHYHRFPQVQHLSDPAVATHLNMVRLLLASILTCVVKVQLLQDDSGFKHLEFGFDDRSEAPSRKINLLHWYQAIKLLKESPHFQEYLQQQLAKQLKALQPTDREGLLLALYRMKQSSGLFGVRSVNDVNNPALTIVCAELTVCNRLMQEWASDQGWEMEFLDDRFRVLTAAEVESRLTMLEDDQMLLCIPVQDQD
jgi:hypothetical protein